MCTANPACQLENSRSTLCPLGRYQARSHTWWMGGWTCARGRRALSDSVERSLAKPMKPDDRLRVGWRHETRRCRRVTYPESYITKYTSYTKTKLAVPHAVPLTAGRKRIPARVIPFTRGAFPHTLSPSLSHTHTHSLSLSLTHTLTLSHTHTHTHTLSLSHTHTLTLSLSHTHSLSLSHTHTLTLSPAPAPGTGRAQDAAGENAAGLGLILCGFGEEGRGVRKMVLAFEGGEGTPIRRRHAA
jgi:hypothetical protein